MPASESAARFAGSAYWAPTMTSLIPSPFTSPAVLTEVPNRSSAAAPMMRNPSMEPVTIWARSTSPTAAVSPVMFLPKITYATPALLSPQKVALSA